MTDTIQDWVAAARNRDDLPGWGTWYRFVSDPVATSALSDSLTVHVAGDSALRALQAALRVPREAQDSGTDSEYSRGYDDARAEILAALVAELTDLPPVTGATV